MSEKPSILVVDDEIMNLNIVQDLLEDDFDVHCINNGQQCLDYLQDCVSKDVHLQSEKKLPDIIILDVMMPVLDGLETCRQIRSIASFRDIPVIFVSALSSPKEKINGYKAGGDDYLTKPFEGAELQAKINRILKAKLEMKAEVEAKNYATKTAMTSMVSASETGYLISFMQRMLTVRDIDALQQVLADIIKKYGLNACIMLDHLKEPCFFSSDGNLRTIEEDVLLEAKEGGKIIEFSGRAVFNSMHSGILIRKMPEDEEKSGRYKDHLAVLSDSLESKLIDFINEEKKVRHYLDLTKTIKSITSELELVNRSKQQQRTENSTILSDLVQNIEQSFLNLGLEGSQEDTLLDLVTRAEVLSDQNYEKGKASEQIFDHILVELNQLLD